MINQEILPWGKFNDIDDLVNYALKLGWIRIGAEDHEYVFVQMIPKKISKRALSYLLRIMIKFRPEHVAVDFDYGEGTGRMFPTYRAAIQYIRAATT